MDVLPMAVGEWRTGLTAGQAGNVTYHSQSSPNSVRKLKTHSLAQALGRILARGAPWPKLP